MARLLWVGVGAAGTVLLARRVRGAVRRYTPQGVAEQVELAGRGTVGALRASVATFTAARATRESELLDTLLAPPQGGDAGAVFRRGARASDDWRSEPSRPAGARPGTVPAGRVDDDEPLVDF